MGLVVFTSEADNADDYVTGVFLGQTATPLCGLIP